MNAQNDECSQFRIMDSMSILSTLSTPLTKNNNK